MRPALEIGKEIANAGALIHETDEFRAVTRAAAAAIRAERKGAVVLTKAEVRAALAAIGQMTYGNARDFYEWKLSTGGTKREWRALLAAEKKIARLL